jgi:hypothetical protein
MWIERVHLPAGKLDCFLVGAIATIYARRILAYIPPTIRLFTLQQQHTLGFAKADWFKIGLRSIEAGARARAALLNITNEDM